MPTRSSIPKRPRDADEFANLIGDIAADETRGPIMKNPAAVALGKLGGQKGGVARAAKLTPAERENIARKAALSRWKKGAS